MGRQPPLHHDRHHLRPVFSALRRPLPSPTEEFAPGADLCDDDHLVFTVPGEPSSGVATDAQHGSGTRSTVTNTVTNTVSDSAARRPSMRITRALGSKPLYFESLVCGAYGLSLIDSGAEASFVSADWCRDHGVAIRDAPARAGANADGSPLHLLGFLRNVPIKLGSNRFK